MRALVVAPMVAIAACSLVTSLDDLGAGDASNDVNASDAADASLEDATARDADAGAQGFCASLSPAPSFCADFDEDASLGTGFTAISVSPGGALAIDTSTASSLPASLRATIDTDASSSTSASLNTLLPGAPAHIHASFDMKIAQVDSTGQLEFMTLEVASGGATHTIYFRRLGNSAYIAEETHAVDGGFHGSAAPIQGIDGVMPAWVNVRLDVDLVPTPLATITINQTVATKPLTDFVVQGPTQLNVGVTYVSGPTTGWVLSIDNVTVSVSN